MPDTPPRRWALPTEVHDPARLRADAARRRDALPPRKRGSRAEH